MVLVTVARKGVAIAAIDYFLDFSEVVLERDGGLTYERSGYIGPSYPVGAVLPVVVVVVISDLCH